MNEGNIVGRFRSDVPSSLVEHQHDVEIGSGQDQNEGVIRFGTNCAVDLGWLKHLSVRMTGRASFSNQTLVLRPFCPKRALSWN